jgi:hypothetical protein
MLGCTAGNWVQILSTKIQKPLISYGSAFVSFITGDPHSHNIQSVHASHSNKNTRSIQTKKMKISPQGR